MSYIECELSPVQSALWFVAVIMNDEEGREYFENMARDRRGRSKRRRIDD